MRVAPYGLAIILLAGCLGGKPQARTFTDDDEPSPVKVEVAPGIFVSENRGAILGGVRNEANLTLAGVRVTVVGTGLLSVTNATGGFVFLDLRPGSHRLFVQGDGFHPHEEAVSVRSSEATLLLVHLVPKGDIGAGHRPHLHDLWGGNVERILIERDVDLTQPATSSGTASLTAFATAQAAANTNNTMWQLPIIGSANDRPIVLPGTREVEVRLSWDPNQIRLARMGLAYSTADANTLRYFAPQPSGTPFLIPVNATQSDTGHQTFSLWRFFAFGGNSYAAAPNYSPAIINGPLHVKVVLRKGEVVLEDPHTNYWAAGDVLELRNVSRPMADVGVCCPTRSVVGALSLDSGKIVPPGTAKLRIEFIRVYQQNSNTETFDYDMTWRKGSQNPQTTSIVQFSRAQPMESAPGRKVWEITLAPEDTDAFYMRKSNWAFSPWVRPYAEDGAYADPRARNLYLGVWAFKDPNYRSE